MFKNSMLALAVAGIVAGCKPSKGYSEQPAAAAAVSVQVVTAKRGAISRTITLPGDIKANQQATLYAKVSGYLKSITVDKGDQVSSGALLAEIEVPELLAEAAKYKAEAELAQIEWKRVSEAQAKAPDLVVPLTLDTAKGKYEVAKANLERAETLLNFTRITAPFAGIITRRTVDPGAFIPAATAASPQSAALLTIADFGTVRVQVAVPEAEAGRVMKDDPVTVTVIGLPGRSFEGKIARFSFALDEITKTMLAEIELPNEKLELRPGMYATVTLGIERKSDALLLPSDAVLIEKSGASVFRLEGNHARKAPVKTGFTDAKHIEIVEGISGTEPVILFGKRILVDGQAVNVAATK
ncbi:MAG TPA: efflux RND transporter periplasmic adaptor subunit [Verrucomicrobiae bacterium]|nr:efflux RND transporter periplasmic adaptor subunit [Verrucomicrobiae bacterium]